MAMAKNASLVKLSGVACTPSPSGCVCVVKASLKIIFAACGGPSSNACFSVISNLFSGGGRGSASVSSPSPSPSSSSSSSSPCGTQAAKKQKTEATNGDKDDESGVVNVEFSFWDPQPSDYHSVKLLLTGYLDTNSDFDIGGFADAVCEQVSVGTMIKADGTEDQPIGFLTVLNVYQHKDKAFMKQIKKFILDKAPPKEKQQIKTLWETQQTKGRSSLGLIVNARLLNVPPQLIPALHNAVLQDLEWAIKNEDTEELKKSFDFANMILLGRRIMYDQPYHGRKERAPPKESSTVPKKVEAINGKSKDKKKGKVDADDGGIDLGNEACFKNFEEQYYQDHADLLFSWRCAEPKVYSESTLVPQENVVALLTMAQVRKCTSQLATLV